MSQFDPVWDELTKIDYFLDHLARAVERGDAGMPTYDAIAPRYLARRAELAAVLEAREAGLRAAEAPVAPPVAPAAVSAEVPAAATPDPEGVQRAWEEEFSRAAEVPPRPGPMPDRAFEPMARTIAPREVPWPTVLTFVGAFLVIIAAAIFAVAAWGDLGVAAKLGFLGVLTVGFYGWSELVRARLKSQSGSVALAVVAAAMLVFDGWIAIDGYHLAGPLPWAVLALTCSLAYWAMELRIAGGLFGAIGAAAQVAWWWLLGSRFDWPLLWIAAGLAVVAVAWDLGARRVPAGTPAATLATILKWAAPITATACVPVAMYGALSETPVFADAIASAVLAAAVVAVLHHVESLPAGAGAVGSVPMLVVVSTIEASALPPAAVVLLVAVAAGYTVWEARVRGWTYAVLALYFELLTVVRVADTLKLGDVWTQGLMAALALAWIAAAALLDRGQAAERTDRLPGIVSLRWASEVAGWGWLAIMSLTVFTAANEAPPLLGLPTGGAHVALASFCTVVWFAAIALRGRRWPGAFAIAGTFYSLAALIAWRAPGLNTGRYAVALIALAVVWSQSRDVTGRLTRLPRDAVVWGMRFAALVIPLAGLAGALLWGSFETGSTVAMLGAAALFWLADSLRDSDRLPLLFAPAAIVGAVALWGRILWGPEYGAPAGALTGLVLAEGAFTLSRWRKTDDAGVRFWTIGASAAATLAAFLGNSALWSPREVSAALVVAGIAWVVASRAGRIPQLTALGGAVATTGILAMGEGPPLLGMGTTGSHVLVATAVALVWLTAGRLERWPLASGAGIALSFYALAGAMVRLAPTWQSASYALGLILLAGAWYAFDGLIERVLYLPRSLMRLGCATAVALALAGGLAGSSSGELATWPVVIMLAAAAGVAVFDAARRRDLVGVVAAPPLLVVACGLAAVVSYRPPAGALLARPDALALAASAAALVLASIAAPAGRALGTRDARSVRAWAFSAAVAATLSCVVVVYPLGSGAIAVGALAAAWVVAAALSREPRLAWVPALVGLWWAFALFDRAQVGGGLTVAWLVLYAYALAAPSFVPANRADGTGRTAAGALLPVGAASLVVALVAAFLAWSGVPSGVGWLLMRPEVFAVALAAAGAWLVACSWAWSVEPGYYLGFGLVLASLLAELHVASVTTTELYTVPVGLYLIAMGHLFAWIGEGRRVPPGTDVAGALVLLGVPAIQSVVAGGEAAVVGHAYWAIGLSLFAIAAGVLLRCRAYFFGGVAALVWTALFRSWGYLVAYWWIVLGVVGVGLLAVALTWERRRLLLDGTRRALEGWR